MTIDSQRRFDELAQVRLALHGPRGGAVHRPGAPDAGAARNPNRKFREQRRRGAITPKQRCQRGLRFGIGAVNAGKRRDFSASTGGPPGHPDWLAEGPVWSEPVSAPRFPCSTGKYWDFCHFMPSRPAFGGSEG